MKHAWFDDELLQEYTHTFYGYGNFAGHYWFVGMEEGSTGKFEEIESRLEYWRQRGRPELEDVVEYHEALGVTGLFGRGARLQPTWSKLIRVLLSAQGHDNPHHETVRQYQASRLGRHRGQDCLLELMPLPSRSTGDWMYGNHSRLPELTTRESYLQYYRPKRISSLNSKIRLHNPRAVIFYSVSPKYQNAWKQVAGVPFVRTNLDRVSMARNEHTVFVIMPHPVSHGISRRYLHEIGTLIANVSSELME